MAFLAPLLAGGAEAGAGAAAGGAEAAVAGTAARTAATTAEGSSGGSGALNTAQFGGRATQALDANTNGRGGGLEKQVKDPFHTQAVEDALTSDEGSMLDVDVTGPAKTLNNLNTAQFK